MIFISFRFFFFFLLLILSWRCAYCVVSLNGAGPQLTVDVCNERLLRLFTHARDLILKFLCDVISTRIPLCSPFRYAALRHLRRIDEFKMDRAWSGIHSRPSGDRLGCSIDPSTYWWRPWSPWSCCSPWLRERQTGERPIKHLTNDLTFSFSQMARTPLTPPALLRLQD